MKKLYIIFILFLIFFSYIMIFDPFDKTNISVDSGSSSSTNYAQKIDFTSMVESYNKNSIKAENTYSNQDVEITGIVKKVDRLTSYGPYVELEDEQSTEWIWCVFNESDKDILSNLNVGQKVIIRGIVTSSLMGKVGLVQCSIIN